MPATDPVLTCRDCGGSFVFSEDEHQSFAVEGHFHPPSRCAACRETRKARQSQSGERPLPPAFRELRQVRTSVVCSACGQPAVVPFAPRAGRAVYCSNCYSRRRSDDLGA
jgi:CxxC-x17-CxxC domain-containing protein